jgi:hypothetical protein
MEGRLIGSLPFSPLVLIGMLADSIAFNQSRLLICFFKFALEKIVQRTKKQIMLSMPSAFEN